MQSLAPGMQQLWSLSGHLAVTTVLRSMGAAANASQEDRMAMLQVKTTLDAPSAALTQASDLRGTSQLPPASGARYKSLARNRDKQSMYTAMKQSACRCLYSKEMRSSCCPSQRIILSIGRPALD